MNETYRAFAEFAQTWGLLYFVGIFLCVLLGTLAGALPATTAVRLRITDALRRN